VKPDDDPKRWMLEHRDMLMAPAEQPPAAAVAAERARRAREWDKRLSAWTGRTMPQDERPESPRA